MVLLASKQDCKYIIKLRGVSKGKLKGSFINNFSLLEDYFASHTCII